MNVENKMSQTFQDLESFRSRADHSRGLHFEYTVPFRTHTIIFWEINKKLNNDSN